MSTTSSEKHAGYGWLLFCATGMITSLTLYGVVLEYATSGGRKLHEVSFIFVTTSIYALTAYIARSIFQEEPSKNISKYQMLSISLMSIASAYTSVRSLRYVIYPVQVLFKSCKPVPVMAFGVLLGQKYSFQKYVNVIVITAGVALFMGGGSSTSKKSDGSVGSGGADTTLIGALILSLSLCFDGATGAYEDKMMSGENSIGPYDLMFNIQLGKSVISFCALIIVNGVNDFLRTVQDGGLALVILGLTGAMGQIFLYITIAKFGALNCALLGLLRKMLSLVLSFFIYGHTLNAVQTVGLALSVAAMGANFYGKSDGGHGGHSRPPVGDEESQAGHSKRDRPSVYRDKVEVEDEDNDDNDKTPLMSSTQPPPPPSPRGDIEMNPITNSKQAEGNLLDLEPSVSSVPSTLPPTEVPTETPLDLSTDSSTVVLDRGAGRTAAPVVPSLSPSSSSQILNQQRRAVPSATDMLEMESSPVGSPKRMKDLTATSQSTASRDRLIAKALADFVPTRLAAPINAGPTGGVSINANNNSTGNGSGSGSGGSNKKQATSNGQKQSGQRRSSS